MAHVEVVGHLRIGWFRCILFTVPSEALRCPTTRAARLEGWGYEQLSCSHENHGYLAYDSVYNYQHSSK